MPPRGPKPTPTPIQRLRGNPRKQKKTNAPEYETAIPEPPKHLDPVAVAEWYRVAEIMAGMQTITNLDRSILMVYCQTHSDLEHLTTQAKSENQFLETPNGYVYENPKHVRIVKLRKELQTYAAELGFSPTSRNKVQMVAGKTEEKTAEAKLADKIFARRSPQPKSAKPV